MELRKTIKDVLEKTYRVEFDVSKISNSIPEIYCIKLANSYASYFDLRVHVKDDTRLTIECNPEKYGAEFVEIISKSDMEQRSKFCEYWNRLKKDGKTILKINEIPCDREKFINNKDKWNKFSVRFTKPLYYDTSREKKDEVITNYIKLLCGMMFSLFEYEVEGINNGYKEGNIEYVKSKKYERNPLNRVLCIEEKGCICSVCEFDFYKVYGTMGKDFIHVHHSIPVSEMGDNYIVNVSEELFPVCPNCHAMLHKKNPPYTIQEMKRIIEINDTKE